MQTSTEENRNNACCRYAGQAGRCEYEQVEDPEIAALRSPQPIPRPRPLASCHISRIRQATPVDRQAAAADAFGKPGPQALQLGYALVDAHCPLARQP